MRNAEAFQAPLLWRTNDKRRMTNDRSKIQNLKSYEQYFYTSKI